MTTRKKESPFRARARKDLEELTAILLSSPETLARVGQALKGIPGLEKIGQDLEKAGWIIGQTEEHPTGRRGRPPQSKAAAESKRVLDSTALREIKLLHGAFKALLKAEEDETESTKAEFRKKLRQAAEVLCGWLDIRERSKAGRPWPKEGESPSIPRAESTIETQLRRLSERFTTGERPKTKKGPPYTPRDFAAFAFLLLGTGKGTLEEGRLLLKRLECAPS